MTNGERPVGPTDRIERIEVALELLTANVAQVSLDVNTLRAISADNERRRESTENRMEAFERRMDEHAEQMRVVSLEVRGLQYENCNILDILQRRFGGESP